MGGMRISGARPSASCSPPVTAYRGAADPDGFSAVWRSCSDDAPGNMTEIGYVDWADGDQNSNPCLSPGGDKIAFTVLGASTGYDELWVVDAAPGSTPVKLLDDPANYIWHPAWIDNDTIVYCHFAGGSFEGGGIYSIPAAGGTPTLLKAAAGGFSPRRPQGNHDGTKIAYIWDEDSPGSACELRVMDADGSNDALVDTLESGYLFNDPPQFGWANASNLIAYTDGGIGGARDPFVIDADGTGKTQLNTAGDAAGIVLNVSHLPFAPDDSFIVMCGDLALGDGIQPIRCELDGSGANALPVDTGFGPENRNWFRACLVYGNRIWWIRDTSTSNRAMIQSCALDGSDCRVDFDNTLGAGDLVEDFTGGDGWYWN